jgi:ribonucleoside-diphosphate reductase alpha chain
MGHTTNPDIRIAKSVVDYIFRWMGITFMPGFKEMNAGSPPPEVAHGGDSAERPSAVGSQPSARESKPTASDSPKLNGTHPTATKPAQPTADSRQPKALKIDGNGGFSDQQSQFAGFQTDAPSCDNCGSITVRNGNCYLCYSCGNSMGCS